LRSPDKPGKAAFAHAGRGIMPIARNKARKSISRPGFCFCLKLGKSWEVSSRASMPLSSMS
jgi:hypothetical protein